MGSYTRTVLVLALLGCLALVGAVLAAPAATTLERWVMAGGGGRAAGAPYSLDGTIGQPLVGWDQHAGHALCAGFWCGAESRVRIWLPLVVRDS